MEHVLEPLYRKSAQIGIDSQDKTLRVTVAVPIGDKPSNALELPSVTLDLLRALNQHLLNVQLKDSTVF